MIPVILGTAALAGVAAGAAVTVCVYWKTAGFLIRHSQYRNHTLEGLFSGNSR